MWDLFVRLDKLFTHCPRGMLLLDETLWPASCTQLHKTTKCTNNSTAHAHDLVWKWSSTNPTLTLRTPKRFGRVHVRGHMAKFIDLSLKSVHQDICWDELSGDLKRYAPWQLINLLIMCTLVAIWQLLSAVCHLWCATRHGDDTCQVLISLVEFGNSKHCYPEHIGLVLRRTYYNWRCLPNGRNSFLISAMYS